MGAPRLRKRDVRAALVKNHGLVTHAATDLGATRQSIYNALKRWPDLEDDRRQARAGIVDMGEGALYRKAAAGEAWAVQFLLRTLGRDRGYGDRLELQHGGRVDLANLSDEELRAIRDGAATGDDGPDPVD